MWEEIKPKKFHKIQVTIPFFHVDLLLSHVQCVHLASIRKDVASIHTSIASCEYYDWSVLAASILHARFVPKIRMRKHSMRTNVRLQYACCTFAACMLRTRSTQAASFFSARSMFAIFISVLFSSGLLWWVSKECGMGQGLVLVSPCFREKHSCHMQNWVFLV